MVDLVERLEAESKSWNVYMEEQVFLRVSTLSDNGGMRIGVGYEGKSVRWEGRRWEGGGGNVQCHERNKKVRLPSAH